jgi:hypothetical protein
VSRTKAIALCTSHRLARHPQLPLSPSDAGRAPALCHRPAQDPRERG